MNRTLFIAIVLSLVIHTSFIAAIVVGMRLFSKEMPGPGGEVQVWLSIPGAGAGAGIGSGDSDVTNIDKNISAKKSVVQKAPARDEMSVKSERVATSVNTGELPKDSEAANKKSETGGGGAGLGSGGTDLGRGGNPLLASIWRKINSSKYYPSSARRKGISGAPRVAFAINEDGRIGWVRLEATCGIKDLDDAALETVRRAAPLPYYPKPISVVVKYSLSQ